MNRARREHHPSIYKKSPYMDSPLTTVLPKKRGGKSDDVMITGKQDTGIYFMYENVDSNKSQPGTYLPRGWLSRDHMDAWIQLLIRERPKNANWTLSKSGIVRVHRKNNRFMMMMTNPHIMGTLDGTTRSYPAWKDVNWVYMAINAGENHWVTGAINLTYSVFYVFDSLHSDTKREDRGRQLALMNLGHQFDDTIIAKDELQKSYEECRDIPLEQRVLIEDFL
uniref:Ubiquitin-like protease family profile domain-containing protein n=1 Tax=Tanacetum cinerariifolium TaxID=118510 RepID=A0A699H2H7_TANCI|nr:hypothetical protein [Tanacetum cinerariifolium]